MAAVLIVFIIAALIGWMEWVNRPDTGCGPDCCCRKET